ncbi:MAG: hypothetical protein EA416_06325 [Trueperaceae bacterium]|nr:MAG: hypothetical protein EA416_06325 [Trueperaceae bacterium]
MSSYRTFQRSDRPDTVGEVVKRCADEIMRRLPPSWSAALTESPERSVNRQVHRTLVISSPNDQRATLALAPKLSVQGRDVSELERGLRQDLARPAGELQGARPVVVAPYLSPPVRARLQEADLSFADATGNVRIELSHPGLFLADRGADADPWRGPGRPRGSLKGEPAARVVRALLDFDKHWRMRELIDAAGTSTGATYRVVDYLEREGLAERDPSRSVRATDWQRLLRAWSTEYSLTGSSRVTRWIAVRGIPHLLGQIASASDEAANTPVRYALTGTLAAAQWAPAAPATLAMVYASDATAAAAAWGLVPAEAGANTVLAEPPFDLMLERTSTTSAGLTVAAPAQVAVDLLSGPGRSPSEAETLLSWMERNESLWRIRG